LVPHTLPGSSVGHRLLTNRAQSTTAGHTTRNGSGLRRPACGGSTR
jgi:hypothetical protein